MTDGAYTVSGLPVGEEYSVTETNADTIASNYTLVTGSTTSGAATISESGATVALTNKYEQKEGSLTVTKTFEGDDIGTAKKFACAARLDR